jgi:hypothetical protein
MLGLAPFVDGFLRWQTLSHGLAAIESNFAIAPGTTSG